MSQPLPRSPSTTVRVVDRLPEVRRPRATQAWSLLLVGPFLDRYVVHQWVFQYDYRSAAVACLALSCAVAVGVNVSQFACLGRFSAVSYQARRHLTTV